MFLGMRATANTDQAFWSKPADAEAGWMDDLSSEPVDDAETHALDAVRRRARRPDRPRVPRAARHRHHRARRSRPREHGRRDRRARRARRRVPPPAAAATFDINAVSDDLLPSWNLDLG